MAIRFQRADPGIIGEKKLYIFDMDGTILLGNRAYDFAVRFINNLRKSGKKVFFFTNNSSHTAEFYVKKLGRMGFSLSDDEMLTSGDVAVEFLNRHRPGKSVYLVGTDEVAEDFRKRGVRMLRGDEESADIVVTSFDTSVTYEKLNRACRFVRNGAEYLSTHHDFNCPTETGFIPDSGAIAAFVTASTGVSPRHLGKPHRETVRMISEISGVDFGSMCLFGDMLTTDVAMGRRYGLTSVLLLSGETGIAEAFAAKDDEKPDFIFDSLDDVDGILFGRG